MVIGGAGSNTLLKLATEGRKQLALTKQVQVDPIRRTLDHIDFILVVKRGKVTILDEERRRAGIESKQRHIGVPRAAKSNPMTSASHDLRIAWE